jgi:PAS domain S-box-containing protein
MDNYKEAIESTNIVSKTDVEGIITFVNDEFCKISGYSRDELLGKNHNIVRHPDVDASKFKTLWDTIKSKKIYKDTVKNLAKDGSTFYVNTTVIPILDDDSNIVEFIAIRYDVTKEVLYKEQLQDEIEKNKIKQKIMITQARHASVGQMLANVAHQWRQPLTELNLTLFNIEKSAKDEDALKNYVSRAEDIIKSMSATIDDFTNFFTPNREIKTFLVDEAVNEAINLLEKKLKKSMVDISVGLQNAYTVGVKNELTQVIINIINNSIDAFEKNGVLIRNLDIASGVKNAEVYISIKDNAGGVSKKIIDRIFEPYFTTKHQKSGTGLGLFMSKMICEQGMGGSIDVKSSKKQTTFTIKIPQDR